MKSEWSHTAKLRQTKMHRSSDRHNMSIAWPRGRNDKMFSNKEMGIWING